MQPTLPQSNAGVADMDLSATQSMDWLFKKERIYLLAQFWQQRATLAEKEVNTLKEQLSSTSITPKTTSTITQNGVPGSPPLSTSLNENCLTSKLINLNNNNNNINKEELNDNKMEQMKENKKDDDEKEINLSNNNNTSNINNNSNSNNINSNSRETSTPDSVVVTTEKDSDSNISSSNNNLNNNDNNNSITENNNNNNNSTRTLAEELAAKDKEISALVEEVSRLRSTISALQESHQTQIKRLEDKIDSKRQHITRLECRIDNQSGYDDIKKENSLLRSVDLSPPNDTKQFQELLLERTKALAAQTEALKSSNSDDGRLSSHQENDKTSSHHDTSSRASTPLLHDSRGDDNLHINGLGINSLSLPMSKSPAEDNNNTLSSLTHPAGLIPGLPFQFQERGHFRFADDLQMPPGSMVGRLGDSLIPKGDPMEARLQEMLRYNMDKYSNQSLDTLHISRRVRELLSVHNIGQRLFAKYVLGLSQGTVSELLSKPKPWDKLTEKGRDSYRKMHAWGCDDNAVMLLKSLIPKKDSGMSQYGRPEGDITEERIQHILGEAANLMRQPSSVQQQTPSQQVQQTQQPNQQQLQSQQQQQQIQQQRESSLNHTIKIEDSHSLDDSKSPNTCTSPFKDSSKYRIKKYDNDDISQEKVARIYQEELAKLMRTPSNIVFPNLFSGGMPPASAQQLPDENIRLAFEAYHRELAKLQASGANLPNFPNFPNLPGFLALQQQALNGAQDLSLPKDKQIKLNGQQTMTIDCESIKDVDDSRHSGSAFSLVRPKGESNPTPTTTASSAPSPIGNSILPPAITPTDDMAASPLQRMASITNSLITQPPVTPHHSTPQRPLKAVLPPITQQQFDMFNNLNTEDIVRRVKEALSQYSISQRLFGESVLGLSQGSVSDLLARPKPWHMLTQKGREPFIRMKMFLEDENAVHKLVASQYKIAPEKLMRTGSYSGSATPVTPSMVNKMPMIPKIMNETLSKLQQEQQQQMLQQLQQQASPMSHISTPQPPQTMLLTPPGMPPHHAIALTPQEKKPSMPMPIHSPQQQSQMRNMSQHMSPTVYEMAALTQDLDTQVITTKIKEALLANNIGQKIFGEAVLGLSQGSVSELLSKPKPWHMLSIKGREPFIRMQLWLADTNNVERLQVLKNERREASKRRRSTGPGAQDNSSDTSSNDTSEFYHSNSPGPASVGSSTGPPNKKQRVLFSEEQKEALRLAFALDPYPNVATIEFLANELGLSTRTITNWFHNHRMRLKQQVPHGAPSEPVPSRDSQSGAPFDQNQFRTLLHQRLVELQKERMGLSGVPLPYAPYFAANPNLAALIGRGILPGGDAAHFAALNAFKEQMNGLDLSLKRDGDDDFEEIEGDNENDQENDRDDHDRDDEVDDRLSDNESMDESDNLKRETKTVLPSNSPIVRSSRRKPAAPQWVNPDWQDDKTPSTGVAPKIPNENEVIINGVCVMQQAADYSRLGSEETVRIEPTGVERFNDDDQSDVDDDDTDKEKIKDDINKESSEDKLNDVKKPEDSHSSDELPTQVSIKTEIDNESDRWEAY